MLFAGVVVVLEAELLASPSAGAALETFFLAAGFWAFPCLAAVETAFSVVLASCLIVFLAVESASPTGSSFFFGIDY